ncbi:hypothetical protein EEL30_06640 [Brevibacillus laterosporus]|uniref:Uncharacterized protein n=1 Tax=Brevibacillus laterosporus TaxID=1465 RepID=A0A518V504_BRELA|nr:hypothetical protein EEL30_06640 [Brevibacillus laterosporus]
MKTKLIFFLAVLVFFVSNSANVSYAATIPSTNYNIQIPTNIKKPVDFIEYLFNKGLIKNFNDARNYMESNKVKILKLDPKLVDYGFTTNFYAEINQPSVNNGVQPSAFNQNTYIEWIVPVVVYNSSKQTQEISKESFNLVPHVLAEGNELHVLALNAEYIKDRSNGAIVGNVKVAPETEQYINVVFHIYTPTFMENVKIRLYDGKDHTDVKITKK